MHDIKPSDKKQIHKTENLLGRTHKSENESRVNIFDILRERAVVSLETYSNFSIKNSFKRIQLAISRTDTRLVDASEFCFAGFFFLFHWLNRAGGDVQSKKFHQFHDVVFLIDD